MSTIFSKQQQIYSLSFSVNSAFGLSWKQSDCKSGMIEMQKYVTKVADDVVSQTASLIGNWKPVWGPIVYANDPTSNSVHADNTMGMYYNADDNLFVIAIAGTNINSPFGWITEDFSVNTMVSWESITGETNSGKIANGTSIGLHILLDMKDANGNTLIEALANFISSTTIKQGTEVAVAGHSLGGALSPTFALYLLNKKKNWDPTGLTTIGAYPTAGPTPGDKDFATYFEGLIKDKKITYLSQHNGIDVVPHAWQKEDLAEIPTIYEDNIVPPSSSNPKETLTGTISSALALNALSAKGLLGVPYNPYTQISPSTVLNGTFDTSTDEVVVKKLKYIGLVLPSGLRKYADYLRNLARFAAQAATQHTSAYDDLLHISDFITIYNQILKANKPKDQIAVQPYELAVRDIANIDLSTIDLSTIDEKALLEEAGAEH